MMMTSDTAWTTQQIGTQRTSYRAPPSPSVAPFGPAAPLLPATFVDDLVNKTAEARGIYDPAVAYALSVVSGWAYADDKTLSNKLRYYGFPSNSVERISVVNPALLVVSTGYFVQSACGRVGILAFRGTEPANIVNWLTDADVTSRSFLYGKVHAGFYANLEAMWDEIMTILAAATDPNVPPSSTGASADGDGGGAAGSGTPRQPLQALYITGHSLGAAMAVLAAAKLFMTGGGTRSSLVHGIYTYGQPAVGDTEFAAEGQKLFGRIFFRHVFRHDVVPRMPPRSFGDFVHFGEERYSSSVAETWRTSSDLRATQCALLLATTAVAATEFLTRRMPLFRRLPLPYSMDDHSPRAYIQVSRLGLVQG